MKTILFRIIIIVILFSFQSNEILFAQTSKESFENININDINRTYILYLPTDFNKVKNNSLVIALHGGHGRAIGMERLTGFEKISEREKFILIYPNGIDKSWNDGRETRAHKTGIDDVAFISKLIDEMITKYDIDKHKVYVTGISNGAFMSMKLACELSDKITAIAAVAGTMDTASATNCYPSNNVSIMLIQGTKDPLVPFNGGKLKSEAGGIIVSHEVAINHWIKINNCTATPVITNIDDVAQDETTITKKDYTGGKYNTEVLSIIIVNGGHTWAGGLPYLPKGLIGITSKNMNASEEIWSFFKKH